METLFDDNSHVEIRASVCRKHGCMECDTDVLYIPKTCPYGILHAFAEDEPRLRPRRSGKTFELVRRANELLEEGTNVILVGLTLEMAHHISRSYWRCIQVKHPNGATIRFSSIGQVKNGTLRGLHPSAVLTDELTPEQVKEVMVELFPHWFDRGYYTPFALG